MCFKISILKQVRVQNKGKSVWKSRYDRDVSLVSEEDGSVFLLIVGTSEARAGRRPVSVVCVRGDAADADTDTRPMYGCVVSVTTPPGHVGGDTGLIERTWSLGSWDYPTDVYLENPWCYLDSNNVHGDSKEVHLDICIFKLNVDH